jgi:hypothetical protein
VQVINTTVYGGSLVKAVDVRGVDVTGMHVTGRAAGWHPLVVLGHTRGDYTVVCADEATVFSQPLSGVGTHAPPCRAVDVGELLGVFGRRYELEFVNKNAFEENTQDWLGPLVAIAVGGGMAILTGHQDKFFPPRQTTTNYI